MQHKKSHGFQFEGSAISKAVRNTSFRYQCDVLTQIIELSKTEQKLLRILVENRGQTLPRSTLVDRIWTDGSEYVDENALSVTVKRLRDKLEDTPSSPQHLKTVYGIGYVWAVK